MQKNIDIRAEIHNRFDIEVIDAKTGKVRQKAQALNVVCNGYYNQLFTTAGNYRYIDVGSGNGTPSASDTALFHKEAGYIQASGYTYNRNWNEHWYSVSYSVQISETQLVGVTITEVGVSDHYDSVLCTHAMLEDMNGNQISIEKTNTDVVNIYVTRFLHWAPLDNGKIQPPDFIADSVKSFLGTSNATPYIKLCMTDMSGWGYFFQTFSEKQNCTLSKSNGGKTITITANRFGASIANQYHGFPGLFLDWCYGFFLPGFSGYTPAQIADESIGTGDGSKTAFSTWFDVDDTKQITVKVNGAVTSGWHYRKAAVCTEFLKYLVPISENSTPENIIPEQRCNDGVIPIGYWYNTVHETSGITETMRTKGGRCRVRFSPDMVNWSDWIDIGGPAVIPEQYRRMPFLHTITEAAYMNLGTMLIDVPGNIVFDDAPEAGAVVTCTYTPSVIAKDENHVFDFSVTYQLGEYVPE